MAAGLAATIVNAVLGMELGPGGPEASNRFALEGVSTQPVGDGGIEIRIEKLEASALRLASGPVTLEVAGVVLHRLVGQVRIEANPHQHSFEVARAELSTVKVQAAVSAQAGTARAQAATGPWNLGPLAAADGTLRAQIVDAHLLFDADVTVPIRAGEINFRDATVEHVGPDSRMGVSRLGLYVDAPNGRSYLYQFPSAPVDGVEYERRGALVGPWVTDRGKLRLQPFIESLLRQPGAAPAMGFTEQARQLFDRTAVSGDVQLADGRLAAPGLEADFTGRTDRRNLVRLHSEAVGRGLVLEMGSLLVRNAALGRAGRKVRCDEVAGAFTVRVSVDGGKLLVALELGKMEVSGLRLG